jgi:hypothetical protein
MALRRPKKKNSPVAKNKGPNPALQHAMENDEDACSDAEYLVILSIASGVELDSIQGFKIRKKGNSRA